MDSKVAGEQEGGKDGKDPCRHMIQLTPFSWSIDKSYSPSMKVPARIYVNDEFQQLLSKELEQFCDASNEGRFVPALHQVIQVAALPGILGASIALPDIHSGYGFAIGSVAAFDLDDPTSIVSPGGVGFDINCGVRMLRTNLCVETVRPRLSDLLNKLYEKIPLGVNAHQTEAPGILKDIKEIRSILSTGMGWAVKNGYAWPEDEDLCEDRGCIAGANPMALGQKPITRGMPQLGTLGSGNHYLEIQYIEEIYDAGAAAAMGLTKVGQICIMIHCGSRGLGHGFASDIIREIAAPKRMAKDESARNQESRAQRHVPREGDKAEAPFGQSDPNLACIPIRSELGKRYLQGMAAAANFAFVNRSAIAMKAREAFSEVFQQDARELDMHMVYDVAHNIAKVEEHMIDGERKRVLVHRKGASRAFPPGHLSLPERYRNVGQPVLVGGSMGTFSYVLVGGEKSMELTFGSTCHGAGRALSRHAAKQTLDPQQVLSRLEEQGIQIRAPNIENIHDEAPEAYKDVTQVVQVCHEMGISRKVARLKPLGVIKG